MIGQQRERGTRRQNKFTPSPFFSLVSRDLVIFRTSVAPFRSQTTLGFIRKARGLQPEDFRFPAKAQTRRVQACLVTLLCVVYDLDIPETLHYTVYATCSLALGFVFVHNTACSGCKYQAYNILFIRPWPVLIQLSIKRDRTKFMIGFCIYQAPGKWTRWLLKRLKKKNLCCATFLQKKKKSMHINYKLLLNNKIYIYTSCPARGSVVCPWLYRKSYLRHWSVALKHTKGGADAQTQRARKKKANDVCLGLLNIFKGILQYAMNPFHNLQPAWSVR